MTIDTPMAEFASVIAARVADCLRDELTVTPEFLNPRQASNFTGFTAKALERMRQRGEGPPYSKVGKSVRYRVDDLREWMVEGRVDVRGEGK